MFIKLHNANPAHRDKPIIINTNSIVSMREGPAVREDRVDDVTFIFCPPHGTWEVKEKLDQILKLINKTKTE